MFERIDGRIDLGAVGREYAGDPIGFSERILKTTLWDGQRYWLLTARDHPLVAVVGGHALGKDLAFADFSIYWAVTTGGTVLVTSRTQRQIVEQFFGEIRRLLRASELPAEVFQLAVRFPNGGRILGFTSDASSSYTGFHDARGVLVILSEAQSVEPQAWDGLFSCATGANDRIVAVGNATASGGKFFECFRNEAWRTFRVPCSEHPNISGMGAFIPGGPTREWIERMKGEWGAGSPQFLARVDAQFLTEDFDALCKRAWVDEAVRKWETKALEEQARRYDLTAGVDFALTGDKTIIAACQGPVVRELVQLPPERDSMATLDRIVAQLTRLGITPKEKVVAESHLNLYGRPVSEGRDSWGDPSPWEWVGGAGKVAFDASGLGIGPSDMLRKMKYRVVAFVGARRSTNSRRWLNLRSEAAWQLRELLDAGQVALPADPMLADELCSVRWCTNAAGQIQLEDKSELRRRIQRSCDRLDAVSLGLWATFGHGGAPKQSPVHWG